MSVPRPTAAYRITTRRIANTVHSDDGELGNIDKSRCLCTCPVQLLERLALIELVRHTGHNPFIDVFSVLAFA
jgi:hypothetical protein